MVSEPSGRYTYYALADKRVAKLLELAEGTLADIFEEIYACTRYNDEKRNGRND